MGCALVNRKVGHACSVHNGTVSLGFHCSQADVSVTIALVTRVMICAQMLTPLLWSRWATLSP